MLEQASSKGRKVILMSTEASPTPTVVLVPKLIFLLCQLIILSAEVKSLSTVAQKLLSPEEVYGLKAISVKLQYNLNFQPGSYFEPSDCNKSAGAGFFCSDDCMSSQNNTTCHITRIMLLNKLLTGVLPEELANLRYLEQLSLRDNKLRGPIPASLGNLPFLYYLDLSHNRLSGSIPASLWNLKYLIKSQNGKITARPKVNLSLRLDLSYNQLSGSIPPSFNFTFSSASDLLDLQQVDTSSISRFTTYFRLDLEDNQLTGLIPESIQNLTYLSELDLSDNFLQGSVPPSLGKLTHLRYLFLDQNRISGTLPQSLGNLTRSLIDFSVSSNNITGRLPESYADLTSLSGFSVDGNNMSGPLPDFIANNWTSIEALLLHGNNFRGNIPSGIFNLSRLRALTISDIVGDSQFQFPPSANLTELTVLVLRSCSITGQIPKYIGTMENLVHLDLSFNNLTGTIPDSLKMLDLTYMSFSKNMLNETIPDWIRGAVSTKMDLSFNNFSKLTFNVSSSKLDLNLFSCCCNSSTCLPNTTNPNQIMEEYCPRGKPKYHSLFINCGGGNTPIDGDVYEQDNDTSQFYLSEKGNWARSSSGEYFSAFSNSSDYLKSRRCGISVSEAPLYNKARSSPVSLKYYGFCLREGKYSVTLHFAEIASTDDDEDQNSTATRVFDVYIQGERKLTDFNIQDKAGGPNKVHTENLTAHVSSSTVLEIHFYWAGKGTLDTGPLVSAISVTPEFKLGGERLSPLHIALITVGSTVIVVLFLLLFAWMMGWLGNTDHLQEINIGLEKAVTLKELKGATRNFSKKNEIGQGGFGTVYKAELQGQIVAVKKLSSPSEERINELKNEFYTLKSMSHENLVQLLDVYNGKGLQLLVYEYMQNKSLADALFESKSKLKLDWQARYGICLGIANGLVYLHEHPRLKMVHRDIKASNILLDGTLKAKISDFGLASLYTDDDQVKFIRVEVPQGYMAPEYVQGIVTYKADVYSYGVVLLEIVSGRKNAGHKPASHESEFLLDTAYNLQRKGRLVDLVDKKLGIYDARQAIIVLNLAMKCTNISPSLRPTMSEVVSVLVGQRKIYEICPPAFNDSSLAQVDSSGSIELTSRASTTSSNVIKGEDETEHISVSTP